MSKIHRRLAKGAAILGVLFLVSGMIIPALLMLLLRSRWLADIAVDEYEEWCIEDDIRHDAWEREQSMEWEKAHEETEHRRRRRAGMSIKWAGILRRSGRR